MEPRVIAMSDLDSQTDAPPASPTEQLVLVRYSGDLTTKARETRRRFVTRLGRNLKDALRAEGRRGRIERRHDRLYLHIDGDGPLPSSLARVFGAQSLALVEERPWKTLDDLVRHGVEFHAEAVAGKRFAVRARRVGDRGRIAVRSRDVEVALGAALLPHSAGVDLDAPETTAHLEITHSRAFFFRESQRGYGGLPLGVEGRAVALVSGGFDSAVAAWQLQKRGVSLDYVFCNLGGRSHQLGTLRVMKHVADQWSYGVRPHLHAIDFEAVSANLQRVCTMRYWQVVLKRLMVRAAERIAEERGAAAIVTGEALGQVSSQTLQNLAVISRGTDLPILRPLVGCNKDEILAVARTIGTFDLSKVVGEYCALVPTRPSTHAKLDVVEAECAKLDDSLLEEAIARRSVFDLRTLNIESLDDPELQVSSIAPGTKLIDLRTKQAYESWHHPDALFLDFANAMRSYTSFDRSARYVLYCEFGLKSSHLAERMRADGFQAASFQGGMRALMQSCEADASSR
jgi:thiamine biosynthesis protein ThiI